MTSSVFTSQVLAYLAKIDAETARRAPGALADRIEDIVRGHDAWRAQCLNMNPAESLMSQRCRRLLNSDMATRLSEGMPGHKAYPHGKQNDHIDEIEGMIISQVRRQFGAKFVEWRPVSTSMANAVVFFALLSPGNLVLAQDEDGGGNFSYHPNGPLGLTHANIMSMPRQGATFEIDLDGVAAQAVKMKPKMIVVGGSNVLFPYPLQALRKIADQSGAILVYDAAHIGLLISAGDFQKPLREGAHVVTLSTHKIMGGPVGGLILTDDAQIAERIARLTFPGFMQTRDQNKLAALAMALAETAEFGPRLAKQMVANARALAAELSNVGFKIIAAERGHTHTHQIFLELGDNARQFEQRCQAANILLTDCALAGDMALGRRSGARLATHELTRLGMKEAEMKTIAGLIARAARSDTPETVRPEVEALARRHADLVFSFDTASTA